MDKKLVSRSIRKAIPKIKKRCLSNIVDDIDQKTKHSCNQKVEYAIFIVLKDNTIHDVNACCEKHLEIEKQMTNEFVSREHNKDIMFMVVKRLMTL